MTPALKAHPILLLHLEERTGQPLLPAAGAVTLYHISALLWRLCEPERTQSCF